MNVKTMVKTGEYHDSVSLMLVARDLAGLEGVNDAAVVMATEANKSILSEAGLLTDLARQANANDLVISVSAVEESFAEEALHKAEELLTRKVAAQETGEFRSRTLRGAVSSHPEANVAVISVAGRYAADEAWDALHHGLHVLLFSDNVSIEDEKALKEYAVQAGLLMMGPGAGTAYLNGVALGFANAVPPGPVGIVSAAGTGLQEVSCLLAKFGAGITQGLGTGGRDLKAEIGGLMMLAGLQAIQEETDTRAIILVSKPPDSAVAAKILNQVAHGEKPVVVCFLGGEEATVRKVPNAIFAHTLQEAALLGAQAAGLTSIRPVEYLANEDHHLRGLAESLRARLSPGQRYLRGLFSGGTLCYEAQVIWQEALPEPVYSNAPLWSEHRLPDSTQSLKHTAVDLGEEEFTVGRPHPMIDNDLRIRRLLREAQDPELAVLMLDMVLGYGAHPDPVSELGPAVHKARDMASQEGRELIVVASVTGTQDDPQGLEDQVRALEGAGVTVCQSNAAASRLAAMIVS
jgi:succinyl-CoA synthetase alpha subunit